MSIKVVAVFLFLSSFGMFYVNAQICSINENWSLCAPACQGTCSQLLPICPLPCLPGCICNLGFVRDDLSGFCVPLLHCLTPGGLPLLG